MWTVITYHHHPNPTQDPPTIIPYLHHHNPYSPAISQLLVMVCSNPTPPPHCHYNPHHPTHLLHHPYLLSPTLYLPTGLLHHHLSQPSAPFYSPSTLSLHAISHLQKSSSAPPTPKPPTAISPLAITTTTTTTILHH